MTNKLHLWPVRFTTLEPHRAAFLNLLTPDEHKRAERYISDIVRDRFILARGLLRTILGQITATAPSDIRFVYGTRGKPSLPGSDLRFNLSHSEDMALLGVIHGAELGVDVECIRPMDGMDSVARRNFSAVEQTVYFAQPAASKARVFYTCWTRKEAYIKATGDGLKMPLKDFDVTCAPDVPPRLLRAEGDDPARWTLLQVDLGAGYVGAVCVEAPAPSVVLEAF